MKPTEALKPCPFCKSPAILFRVDLAKRDDACIECDNEDCGAAMHADTDEEVITRWNTRAALTPEPVVGEAEALEVAGYLVRHPLRRHPTFFEHEEDAKHDTLGSVDLNMRPMTYETLYRLSRLGSDNGGGDG